MQDHNPLGVLHRLNFKRRADRHGTLGRPSHAKTAGECRSLEGVNGIYSMLQASGSTAVNGTFHDLEQWTALASALDSTDKVEAAAGVQWLSQLLVSTAKASLQAGDGGSATMRWSPRDCNGWS